MINLENVRNVRNVLHQPGAVRVTSQEAGLGAS